MCSSSSSLLSRFASGFTLLHMRYLLIFYFLASIFARCLGANDDIQRRARTVGTSKAIKRARNLIVSKIKVVFAVDMDRRCGRGSEKGEVNLPIKSLLYFRMREVLFPPRCRATAPRSLGFSGETERGKPVNRMICDSRRVRHLSTIAQSL